ncbi:hypothetical protein [Paenibacillus illinoisensis]|uniref:hypothetical protein n=1 Tax=Paenibacillus illinoisensis TaxID=59845 RepID=UPI00203C33BC|nr:hypothetical protein [Paenibacillus illinoisensis]MCM3205639.1 hypothetical protein [Paenibacillus illinoisensis]
MMSASFDRFQPPDERVDIVGIGCEPQASIYCAYCGEPIERGSFVTAYASGDHTHGGECEENYVVDELGITRGAN